MSLKALAREKALKYGVDPDYFDSIIRTESNYDPEAISSAGAMGLGQLMPATAKDYGVRNPFDPDENLDAAAKIIRENLDRRGGDLALAYGDYNAGPKAIDAYLRGDKPLYLETLHAISKVLGGMPLEGSSQAGAGGQAKSGKQQGPKFVPWEAVEKNEKYQKLGLDQQQKVREKWFEFIENSSPFKMLDPEKQQTVKSKFIAGPPIIDKEAAQKEALQTPAVDPVDVATFGAMGAAQGAIGAGIKGAVKGATETLTGLGLILSSEHAAEEAIKNWTDNEWVIAMGKGLAAGGVTAGLGILGSMYLAMKDPRRLTPEMKRDAYHAFRDQEAWPFKGGDGEFRYEPNRGDWYHAEGNTFYRNVNGEWYKRQASEENWRKTKPEDEPYSGSWTKKEAEADGEPFKDQTEGPFYQQYRQQGGQGGQRQGGGQTGRDRYEQGRQQGRSWKDQYGPGYFWDGWTEDAEGQYSAMPEGRLRAMVERMRRGSTPDGERQAAFAAWERITGKRHPCDNRPAEEPGAEAGTGGPGPEEGPPPGSEGEAKSKPKEESPKEEAGEKTKTEEAKPKQEEPKGGLPGGKGPKAEQEAEGQKSEFDQKVDDMVNWVLGRKQEPERPATTTPEEAAGAAFTGQRTPPTEAGAVTPFTTPEEAAGASYGKQTPQIEYDTTGRPIITVTPGGPPARFEGKPAPKPGKVVPFRQRPAGALPSPDEERMAMMNEELEPETEAQAELEPWEIPRNEWVKAETAKGLGGMDEETFTANTETSHRKSVVDALKTGNRVPDDVLMGYRDLEPFFPEAFKGVFFRPPIRESDPEFQQYLENAWNELAEGEGPGMTKIDETITGGGGGYRRYGSTNPLWFRNSGMTKAEIGTIVKKVRAGKKLTDKQARIARQIVEAKRDEFDQIFGPEWGDEAPFEPKRSFTTQITMGKPTQLNMFYGRPSSTLFDTAQIKGLFPPGALRTLRGAVPDRPTTIAKLLDEKWRYPQDVNVIGVYANTPHDIARIGQIWRNPFFETFRIIYIRQGRIAGIESVSREIPASSPAFKGDKGTELARIKFRIFDENIDTVYLLHNHPKGDPIESEEFDVPLTKAFMEAIPEVKGHIIIDSGKYRVLWRVSPGSSALTRSTHSAPGLPPGWEDPFFKPSMDHPLLGTEIRNGDNLADVGRKVSNGRTQPVVLYLNSDLKVYSIQDATYGMLNTTSMDQWLTDSILRFGAQRAFVYIPDFSKVDLNAIEDVLKNNYIEDVVLPSGQSVRDMMSLPEFDRRDRIGSKKISDFDTKFYAAEAWKRFGKPGRHWMEFWSPLSTIDASTLYKELRYKTFGDFARIERLLNRVHAKLSKLTPGEDAQVFHALTGDIPTSNLSPELQKTVHQMRRLYTMQGKMAVDRGLLPRHVWEANKDTYAHYCYARYILGEDANILGPSGKLDLRWLKKRKNLTEAQKRAIGWLDRASISMATGLSRSLHDIYKFDHYQAIIDHPQVQLPNGRSIGFTELKRRLNRIEVYLRTPRGARDPATQAYRDTLKQLYDDNIDKAWAWPNSLAYFEGKMWSAGQLHDEIVAMKHLKQQMPTVPEIQDRLVRLQAAFDQTSPPEDIKEWRLISGKNWGPLNGTYVRLPVYRDIMPFLAAYNQEGHGSGLAKGFIMAMDLGMSAFKAGKVALNPPTMARNIGTNMIQLWLSGISPPRLLLDLLPRALAYYKMKNPVYVKAMRAGVFKTNFSDAELGQIIHELKKTMQTHGHRHLTAIMDFARKMTSFYGRIDDVFKFAKFIQQIEKGATPARAAVDAQKWGMDYSLAHPAVKGARRSVMPFITWWYKVTPLLVESLVKRPWIFIILGLIPQALTGYSLYKLKMTKQALEEQEKELPKWVKENKSLALLPWKSPEGHLTFLDYGYWTPYQNFLQLEEAVTEGNMAKMVRAAGIGNPYLDMLFMALSTKTGGPPIDPFSGRQIYDRLDSAGVKSAKLFEWVVQRFAPQVLATYGPLGKLLIMGEQDKYGRTMTKAQALGSLAGVNIYSPSTEQATIGRRAELRTLRSEYVRKSAELERKIAELRKKKGVAARVKKLEREVKDLDSRYEKAISGVVEGE